jgi:hypothetical protein
MSVWLRARRSTRGEQPDEGVEVDEKNDQIAVPRIVAGRRSSGMRNSNSPETRWKSSHIRIPHRLLVLSGCAAQLAPFRFALGILSSQ